MLADAKQLAPGVPNLNVAKPPGPGVPGGPDSIWKLPGLQPRSVQSCVVTVKNAIPNGGAGSSGG
jgi:hypothetical protein